MREDSESRSAEVDSQESIREEIKREIFNVSDEDIELLMDDSHYDPANKERYDRWYDSVISRGLRAQTMLYIRNHRNQSVALNEYFDSKWAEP